MALFVANNGQLQTIKGIFECKDMLREGVDYETADWLCGRYGAYIDTLYKPILGVDSFNCHFKYNGTLKNPSGNEQNIFLIDDNKRYIRVGTYINSGNNITALIQRMGTWDSSNLHITDCILDNLRIEGKFFKYTINNNNVQFEHKIDSLIGQECSFSMYLFACNNNGHADKRYFHGDIAYFNIPSKINLVPCQLLKPIPTTLDANNIARSAGECGMYDSVSGKFYGNMSTTGTFTVTND